MVARDSSTKINTLVLVRQFNSLKSTVNQSLAQMDELLNVLVQEDVQVNINKDKEARDATMSFEYKKELENLRRKFKELDDERGRTSSSSRCDLYLFVLSDQVKRDKGSGDEEESQSQISTEKHFTVCWEQNQ